MSEPLQSFQFTLFGRAVPKERPRMTRRGRVYTPARTRIYERMLADAALAAMPASWPLNAEYALHMEFYFRPGPRGDCDNLAKVCGDALNGVAYIDDRQVTYISALCATDRNERAVITVERLTEPKAQCAPRKKAAPKKTVRKTVKRGWRKRRV